MHELKTTSADLGEVDNVDAHIAREGASALGPFARAKKKRRSCADGSTAVAL
jgi:hypothetical protein